MRTLLLVGAATAAGNAIAQVIIPGKSKLKGAFVTMSPAANDATSIITISLASAREGTVNGAQQTFVIESNGSDGSAQATNTYHPLDVDVVQGQIVYLHCESASNGGAVAQVVLFYA